MNKYYSIILIYSLNLFVSISSSINWLLSALSMSATSISKQQPLSICKTLPGLTKRQIKFCRRNIDSMDSIRNGALLAHQECKYQFRQRRWNCTLVRPSTVLGSFVEGTREAAFVHALAAAGVSYRITKDCSRGLIERCGCDLSRNSFESASGTYSYKGCSDNILFGTALGTEFVDAAEKHKNQSQERKLLNEHNNRAGREVLIKSLKRECKCHGVSGSCEMRTCWDQLPSFREIGNTIKDKFDGATEVIIDINPNEPKPRIERKNPNFKRHTLTDLVYLYSSPDYCEPDPDKGILGTKDRQCNISSMQIDGCELLCCHRGFYNLKTRAKERCNCKFKYCCEVVCQECEKIIETNYCK